MRRTSEVILWGFGFRVGDVVVEGVEICVCALAHLEFRGEVYDSGVGFTVLV